MPEISKAKLRQVLALQPRQGGLDRRELTQVIEHLTNPPPTPLAKREEMIAHITGRLNAQVGNETVPVTWAVGRGLPPILVAYADIPDIVPGAPAPAATPVAAPSTPQVAAPAATPAPVVIHHWWEGDSMRGVGPVLVGIAGLAVIGILFLLGLKWVLNDSYPRGFVENPKPTATVSTPPSGPGNGPNVDTKATPSGGSFNPILHHFNECVPEQPQGCSFDPGVHDDQVGIAFGVDISWSKGNMNGLPGRCDLIILLPGWYENLKIVDGRFEIYNISNADRAGWIRVLALQRANEQKAKYGCPQKTIEDIPQWTSNIEALKGTDGVTAAPSAPTATPSTSTDQGSAAASVAAPDSCSQETVDCKERRSTVDAGGDVSFEKGDAVAGVIITIDGKQANSNCTYFKSAPGAGSVKDGVVHPWKAEVGKEKPCQ